LTERTLSYYIITMTTTEVDPITNIAIVNEFWVDAEDYHEFEDIKNILSKTVGLIYKHREVDPINKSYRAHFTLKGIRHPAQYSEDIE
jgi:hypothetical protein